MIRTTLNWTVKNLKAMYDEKETLSFNHPIQRQSSQWDNEQQSLLIHSMLVNFPVPSVYLHKMESVEADAKGKHSYSYSVLDGKQRMTTVFSYINGEFALSENIPDVEVEGETYEIAGKYFEDLDEDVQQEILRFRFNIQAFEDVTDEEIEDIFFRLNNSTPLTKPQKSRPLMGVDNSIFVNEILAGRFFKEKCCFTPKQLKSSDDMCTLLQCMMLLDSRYRGYEYDNISAEAVSIQYSRHINGNYPDECRDRLKKIIGFLDNVFYMKDKNLKKINIPVIFLAADEALKQSVTGINFRRWFTFFFNNCKDEYGQYCSSGSIKKEKTIGRINTMMDSFHSFFQSQESNARTEDTAEGATENGADAEVSAEDGEGCFLEAKAEEGSEEPCGNGGQEPDGSDIPDGQEPGSSQDQPDSGEPDEDGENPDSPAGNEAESTNQKENFSGSNGESIDNQENSFDNEDEAAENKENSTDSEEESAIQEAGNAEQDASEQQEEGNKFSGDPQEGAGIGNDTCLENAPDAEDADGEVPSSRERSAGSRFFSTMAAKIHGLVV